MPYSDSNLEKNFLERFNKLKLKFNAEKQNYEVKAESPKNPTPYDFLIKIGDRNIAVVEIKSSRIINSFDSSKLENFASENNIRFVIYGDGLNFTLIDRQNNSEKKAIIFDDLINLFSESKSKESQGIKNRIGELIKEEINVSDFGFLKERIDSLLQQLRNSVEYDEINQTYFFQNPTDINNVENQIFRFLLKDDKPLKTIYRYTTLGTLFAMLNYNSFRMNCLIGMNDTSEVNYAENYVFQTNRNFTLAPVKVIEAYNKRFISSCSLRKDDLNQWRLYAEDSKGVCLILKVNHNQLNSSFIIKRISYGKRNNSHPELDLIKNILARLKTELNINFEFKTLNTWRHFFKPYDYRDEQEVRILYIADNPEIKTEWVLTASHNILNPFVTFKLNDNSSPFHLTEIILGAKCSEKEINQRQFEQFIRDLSKRTVVNNEGKVVREYNIDKLKVSISNISHYR